VLDDVAALMDDVAAMNRTSDDFSQPSKLKTDSFIPGPAVSHEGTLYYLHWPGNQFIFF
jgi:hypothetical protein